MISDTEIAAPVPRRKQSTVGRKLRVAGTISLAVFVVIVAAFFTMSAVTGNHTLGSVTYAQQPPMRGDHSPVWQRCGFYSMPVRDEHAVHSLEHGVVWITYQPGLPQPQLDVLRALTRRDNQVIVSPYPDLPAPVVVSVWGRQVSLDTVDEVRVEQAVRDIRNGPKAPEPGGGCDGPNLWLSGGTGNPE